MSLLKRASPGEERLPRMPLGVDGLLSGRSLWQDALRRLMANRLAVFSGITLGTMVLLFFSGPLWWPHPPSQQNWELAAHGPMFSHPFGTDELGRDMFARIMQGARLSMSLGFAATLVSLCIGVVYGAVSAYVGGRTDTVMMRIVDILYALPFTVFVILLVTVVPSDTWVDRTELFKAMGVSTKIFIMFLAIGAVEWLTMARIVRGQVLGVKKQEYVDAARSLGYGHWHLLRRHIIPNVMGPVIVYCTLTVPAVMLLEAFISFLGLGVQRPQASWGVLIKEGAASMSTSWWLLFIPAFFFSLTLFCLNFLGDGLRDALDPRSGRD